MAGGVVGREQRLVAAGGQEGHPVPFADECPELVGMLTHGHRWRRLQLGIDIAQQQVEDVADGNDEVEHVGLDRAVEFGRHHQHPAIGRRHETREVDETQLLQRRVNLRLRRSDVPQQQRQLGGVLQDQRQVQTVADLRALARQRVLRPIWKCAQARSPPPSKVCVRQPFRPQHSLFVWRADTPSGTFLHVEG